MSTEKSQEQKPAKPFTPRRSEQDTYSQEELALALQHAPRLLEAYSRYELDVGGDGRIKLSKIRKAYIQHEDVQNATCGE